MKPHNPVTLIDFEGNLITFFGYNEPIGAKTVHCKKEIDGKIYIFRGNRFILTEVTVNEEWFNGKYIVDFLNDQLTFIRNGMWETLAIYQATIGKYWEVPIYERDSTAQHYYMPLIDGYKFKKDRVILTRVFSEKRLNLFKPSFQDFIQFYNIVFSKLTAYEGE